MTKFDFITHDDLRVSLESDYTEMQAAIVANAYKTVHVLSGSIIEAVLVEHLLVSDYKSKTNKDPLNMMLDKLIEACKDEQVISHRVADLSTVIRSYRNLIHPARMVRLNEKVDLNGAKVAVALVEMILDELIEKRKKTYGYTAKQVIDKLYKDPSVEAIIEDLLKQTNKLELDKLLASLPNIDIDAYSNDFERYVNFAERVKVCFTIAFELAQDALKVRTCQRFAQIIREGSEEEVNRYGNSFFRADYLKYLEPEDQVLVKKHIFHRLPTTLHTYSELPNGIGAYLSVEDVRVFVSAVIKAAPSKNARSDLTNFVSREYVNMGGEAQEMFLKLLDTWSKHYSSRSLPEVSNRLEEIRRQISLDEALPF